MSNNNHPSYRPNLNRNITRKWVEAQSVDYDGDDWGGDEYDDDGYEHPQHQPAFAGPQGQSAWGQRNPQASQQRSFTNPTMAMNTGRQSFERDDERRYFSSGGFGQRDLEQPAQRHVPQSEMSERGYGSQLPLHGETYPPGQSLQNAARPLSRDNPQMNTYGAPHSAPPYNPQHGYSDDRIRQHQGLNQEIPQNQQPLGVSSLAGAHAPRASSLNQGPQPLMHEPTSPNITSPIMGQSDNPQTKPPQFIRPADIYKRVEQEREKERRSQESSRPSIDSGSGRAIASPGQPADPFSSKSTNFLLDENETPKRTKPSTLDTVAEQRSEYGMSPTGTSWTPASNVLSTNKPVGASPIVKEERHISHASPKAGSTGYTDRRDLHSASGTFNSPFAQSRNPKTDSPQRIMFNYSPSMSKPSGLQLSNLGNEPDEDDFPNFDRGVSPKLTAQSPNTSPSIKTATTERQEVRPTTSTSASDKSQWQQAVPTATSGTSNRLEGQRPTNPDTKTRDKTPDQRSKTDIPFGASDTAQRERFEPEPRTGTSEEAALRQAKQGLSLNTSQKSPYPQNRQSPLVDTPHKFQNQQVQPEPATKSLVEFPQHQQFRSTQPAGSSDTLRHQPSLGYKSVVHQAFDAENTPSQSLTSTNEERSRSDSVSTTEVSPIIAKHSVIGHNGRPAQALHDQIIPEDSTVSHDRSGSVSTIKAPNQDADTTILPATTFVPGYRRDLNLPVTEENKARKPLDVERQDIPEAQQASLSDVDISSESTQEPNTETLAATQYTPLPTTPTPAKPSTSQSALALPTIPRTTSEDWQEWQAQRRQFNAKHGIQDSSAGSPTISSPVSRAESPAKGTVRDIAGKLESNSGRSSPVNIGAIENKPAVSQRPPQTRDDSFRPVLPGGWSSFTSDTGNSENLGSLSKMMQPQLVQEHSRTESTESIPTATAPRQRGSADDGPTGAAFAAAAAAGSAMAGAFSGSAFTRTGTDSDTNSDYEGTSEASEPHPPETSETRDFALKTPQQSQQALPTEEAASKTSEAQQDASDKSHPGETGQRTDFPAPLRMSRFVDNKQSSPRISAPSTTSVEDHHDPEQLQNEIVQSLTPKTSSIDDATTASARVPIKSTGSEPGLHRQVSIISVDDDVLPQEYRSYWENQIPSPKPIDDQQENIVSAPASSAIKQLPTTVLPERGINESSSVPSGHLKPATDRSDSSMSSSTASTSSAPKTHVDSINTTKLATGRPPIPVVSGGDLSKPGSTADTSRTPTTHVHDTSRSTSTTGRPLIPLVSERNVDSSGSATSRPPIPNVHERDVHRSGSTATKPSITAANIDDISQSDSTMHRPPIPIVHGLDTSEPRSSLERSPVPALPEAGVSKPSSTVGRPPVPIIHGNDSRKSSSSVDRPTTPEVQEPQIGNSNSVIEKFPVPAVHQGNVSKSSSYSTRTPLPSTVPATGQDTTKPRPFLDQRYSWETGLDENNKPPGTETPGLDFKRDVVDDRPSTPTDAVIKPPSVITPPAPTVLRVEGAHDTSSLDASALLPPRSTAPSTFPQPKADFRNILSFQDPSQRIRAFDENRRLYAEHNGLLDQWLSHMNVPEHADVLHSSSQPYKPQHTNTTEVRPSPRRDMTSSSGTKQMQEDGKRLLAAAGKYGGKAGTVAKGIFARGKDKFRTASSGEKAPPTNRRQSSNSNIDTISYARAQEPVLPERPPQLPTLPLETPPGEPGWSTLSSRIDQMFRDRSQQNRSANAMPASGAARSLATANNPSTRHIDASGIAPPPKAVVQSLPGVNPAPAKLQKFPKYDVGVEPGKTAASSHGLRMSDQSTGRNTDILSKVSTEDDHSTVPRVGALPVPRQRRPSSISDVSDVSAHPDETNEVPLRNVSPTHEHPARGPSVPAALAQRPTKQDEALAERDHQRTNRLDGTLPAYNGTNKTADQLKQPRIAPGAQIVPVADLHSPASANDEKAGSRPFSFIGSETLNHALAQQAGLHAQSAKAQPPSATRGNTVEDPEKDLQPSLTEHPAYRNKSRNSSLSKAENPLPSSRRPDLDQVRQPQQVFVPQQEQGGEGFRIPGPYVQEYRSPRSPKPTFAQETSQDLVGGPGNPPVRSSPTLDRQAEGFRSARPTETPSQYEQRPEFDRSRGKSFGSIFRTKSKSPTRRQTQGTTPIPSPLPEDGKRRKGFFSLGNRSSSPSRQMGEQGRDIAGVQETNQGRKLSFDMLRPSAPSTKLPTDSKKKRSSGIAGLFGKASSRERDDQYLERSNSMTTPDTYQSRIGGHNFVPTGQSSAPSSAIERPYGPVDVRSDQQPAYPFSPTSREERYPAASSAYQETRGYYGPAGQYENHTQAQNNIRPDVMDISQIYAQSQNSATTPISGHTNVYHATGSPSAPPPSNYSAVPNTRVSKDISYGQDRPYVPPASPGVQYGSPTTDQRGDMNSHVKNLHKRSRSPRLGRPPSDEHVRVMSDNQENSNSSSQRLSPDPASQLGTFTNKRLSPAGGVSRSEDEQEKPWIIGLPDAGEDDRTENEPKGRSQIHPEMLRPHGHDSATHQSALVSPTTPHPHGHREQIEHIVSPMTAVEPKNRGFNTNPVSQWPIGSTKSAASDSRPHEDKSVSAIRPSVDTTVPEKLSVPPTISNADQIPNPNPQPHDIVNTHTVGTGTSIDQAQTLPSLQASRSLKQAAIERTPDRSSVVGQPTSKPLTVAEKVMGIQPAARGTNLEHRSTTPIPHSPAPSVGAPPKSTTWPDANPSTAAVSTTNTGSTTVTTTTIRAGSKLGRDKVRTSTYVVDSSTPSRASSVAGTNKAPTGNKTEVLSSTPAPVASVMNDTHGNNNLKLATGSKRSTNQSQRVSHGKSFDAVELPGSKPDGYESEEEPMMSATAYPGQEWMPDLSRVHFDD